MPDWAVRRSASVCVCVRSPMCGSVIKGPWACTAISRGRFRRLLVSDKYLSLKFYVKNLKNTVHAATTRVDHGVRRRDAPKPISARAYVASHTSGGLARGDPLINAAPLDHLIFRGLRCRNASKTTSADPPHPPRVIRCIGRNDSKTRDAATRGCPRYSSFPLILFRPQGQGQHNNQIPIRANITCWTANITCWAANINKLE